MDDPVIKALGIKFVYCIEMDFEDADMFDVPDAEEQELVWKVWSDYVFQQLAEMRKLEEVCKISVVAKNEENVVVEIDKDVLQQVEEILLLPYVPNKEDLDDKKKGASGSTTRNIDELEILVKIKANKWGENPLYLGLGFHSLYWKWFMGNSFRYIFKTKKEKDEIMNNKKKLLPLNTRILSAKTSYMEMLGSVVKMTGKLKFEGRNFVKSLSLIHDCTNDNGPQENALAYLVIYLIEAVRFKALRDMDLHLFRFSPTDTHEWDIYIMDLLNDWEDYSKQIFKDERKIDTSPFYTSRQFCNLESVMVKDKSNIYRILAVALGTEDSDEWIKMIQKAKGKTKPRRNK